MCRTHNTDFLKSNPRELTGSGVTVFDLGFEVAAVRVLCWAFICLTSLANASFQYYHILHADMQEFNFRKAAQSNVQAVFDVSSLACLTPWPFGQGTKWATAAQATLLFNFLSSPKTGELSQAHS